MAVTHACAGRYAGQHVLITGGANGLGYASAERLAAEGAAVGLIDVDPDRVEEMAARLRAEGHGAQGLAADVSDEAQVRGAVASFVASSGRIDALVTMAGIYPWTPFGETTLAIFKRITAVNLEGTFLCTQAVLPTMKEQGYGRIVTVSSETVLIGIPDLSAYIASKAGVIGLTRALAREGGPHGITANTVLPGLVATENTIAANDDPEALFAAIIATQSIPRRGEPEDVADAVAYLASRGASFVTGQSLAVGGGDRFL